MNTDTDPTPPHGTRRPSRWRLFNRHSRCRVDACAECTRRAGYVTNIEDQPDVSDSTVLHGLIGAGASLATGAFLGTLPIPDGFGLLLFACVATAWGTMFFKLEGKQR